MKKIISFMLLTILCCQVMLGNVSAEAFDHDFSTNENSNIRIYYSMDGDKVVENISFLDNVTISVKRTIAPNGEMVIITKNNEEVTTNTLSNSDYSRFYQMYIYQNTPLLLNSDITGSQYIHQYIGSPPSNTTYYSEIKGSRDVAAVVAVILSKWSADAAIVAGVGAWIYDRMLDSMNGYDKVVYGSDTYQVLFAIDKSYYIHCYHTTAKFYESGATRPSETITDYYQAYGG